MHKFKIFFLYLFTVFAWGSAFYSAKLQTGTVPIEWSIFYRFILSALIIFLWLCFFKKFNFFKPKDHLIFIILGATLFSFHFFAVYKSTTLVVSGITAIGFSSIVFINVFIARILLKDKFKKSILIGSSFGFVGIFCIYYTEISNNFYLNFQTILGLFLAFVAAMIASFGNVIFEWFNKKNTNTIQIGMWGMIYGSIFMLIYALFFSNKMPSFELNTKYILSLIHLIFICTILAFWSYLSLVSHIGSTRAAYTWIATPVVALFISYFYENYIFSILTFAGIIVLLFGNYMILKKTYKK